MKSYQICNQCILDSKDDQDIFFDAKGICNHCNTYDKNLKKYYFGADPFFTKFKEIIKTIKKHGENQKYDVLIGMSGGVDSSYVAYLCWKNKLRPLVVHLDNGWNSELAVVNIKNILKKTGFDLYTYVINWDEFKDLQKSYFKAHVVDIEALTDHAIFSIMKKTARDNNIKYILNGSSVTTEGRLPQHWVHHKDDHINIKDIHKKFGKIKISSYPIGNFWINFIRDKISGTKSIDILDYLPYNKNESKIIIQKEFKWRDYGGKHHESLFTRFYQLYILPKKFGIDKRKSHLSTLICANQISREEAKDLIKKPLYKTKFLEKLDVEYFLKKMDFSKEEFDIYINSPRIEHLKYKSVVKYINFLVRVKKFVIFTKHRKNYGS